ncbi:MAG: carboxypeptidase M32 [Xanthobacteraceae bacterium]
MSRTTKAPIRAAKVPNLRSGNDRRSPGDKLTELKRRLLEIYDLNAAGSVLSWDEATYMPAGGAAARGRQTATLRRLAHERLVDPALGRLIDDLQPYAEGLPPDADEASLIRVVRRDFEKAIKVPADHVARANAHGSASYHAWTRARPANDFAAMIPYLETTLDLSREYAGFFAPYDHIADPLIDDADEGMTTAHIQRLFSELRSELTPMVRAIADQPAADDRCLRAHFPEAAQFEFGLSVARRFGYDLERGRLDKTHHPFCTKFAAGDVRITTRVRENDLGDALFSTLHEAGHALYEQGVAAALEGTPLGYGVSAGVHESQSRLWENVVARSLGFWTHCYPWLQRTFPEQLGNVTLDTFYRAINKVERSLIRTDADEVTYNLHIMLRFDLELKLLEGRLRVKDLPEAWHAAMQSDLGIAPPDDRDGCLQDVHWYAGSIGGSFQSYTIGNILSAQFFAAALEECPDISHRIERGEFGPLHSWLRDRIYRHGRKVAPNDLVERATGAPMSMAPYLAYLRGKYSRIYELPPAGGR